MHLPLNGWTYQLQTLQMLWLAQRRVFAMVYHRLKSSSFCNCINFGGMAVQTLQVDRSHDVEGTGQHFI